MENKKFSVVTGAYSYSGKYITKQLLSNGEEVITLTNHPDRANPFGECVKAYPYNFAEPEALAETLRVHQPCITRTGSVLIMVIPHIKKL